jgi:ketosteroid isomerase-like protein
VILREVLAYSAAETAAALDTTVASVNSALQRARKTLAERAPGRSQEAERAALGPARQRELIDAFVAAWERADVPAIVELLTEDVRFTMPPLPAWFDGRDDVAGFLTERVFATPWRLVPITANAQPAFGCYQGAGGAFRLGAVNVLSLRDGRIAWIAGFVDPAVTRWFGLPDTYAGA